MWWRLLGDAYLHIRHHCVDVGIIVAVLKDPHCAHQPKLTAAFDSTCLRRLLLVCVSLLSCLTEGIQCATHAATASSAAR